ncbi:uncharacterized protein LOC111037477 [Myzus persicae]|uniref:uncharacterized protein LOC111037477 n=1 Tax=Myzus persicae TaxID=13164 RepID=UPI000B938FD0|nr:uncharacterized protein LOC111037477 [Myzus persicae]
MVAEFYFKNKKLNESYRTLLVELIINDLIKKNRTMTIDLARTISNAIIMAFPTEIKDIYFLKDSTCKAPKGKVYMKYFNTMKKLKNGGLKVGNNNTYEIKKMVYRSEDLLNSSLGVYNVQKNN